MSSSAMPSVLSSWRRQGIVFPRAGWRRRGFRRWSGRGHRSRVRAVRVAAGGEAGRWSRRRSGCRRRRGAWRCSRRAGRRAGSELAGHALDELAVGEVERLAGGAVGEAGRADFGAAEGEGVKTGIGFEQGGRERGGRRGAVGGDADVFGVPAFGAAGGEVGVEAAVGGLAGAGDAAVVDAIEEAGGSGCAGGFGVAGEGGLACDKVGLDVIAVGVGGGDELVGAAVEEEGGAGLLAGVGVGAGIVDAWDEGEGGEGVFGTPCRRWG